MDYDVQDRNYFIGFSYDNWELKYEYINLRNFCIYKIEIQTKALILNKNSLYYKKLLRGLKKIKNAYFNF